LFRADSSTMSTGRKVTPTRAWSVPGHMNEGEMREWMEEMKSGQATPIQREIGEDGQSDMSGSPFDPFDKLSRSSTPQVPSLYLEPDTYPPPPRRNSRTTSDRSVSGTELPINTTYFSRGTVSLDQNRLGGREIADEANMYAFARGARRPDYGRMRGDSRAALLGRDPEGSRERERDKRHDAGDLLGAGLSRNRERERDYGRLRVDSRAALLGRPRGVSDMSMRSDT